MFVCRPGRLDVSHFEAGREVEVQVYRIDYRVEVCGIDAKVFTVTGLSGVIEQDMWFQREHSSLGYRCDCNDLVHKVG